MRNLKEIFEKHSLSPDFQPWQKLRLDKRRQAQTKLEHFSKLSGIMGFLLCRNGVPDSGTRECFAENLLE